MIQFNLLPDVKLAYIKARRAKRLVMLICSVIAGTSLALLLMLFLVVNGVQKRHLDALSRDIKKDSATLQSTPELNKILTIQNQLGSLSGLHDAKPVASRLFGYIAQVTPSNLKMNKLDLDFAANTITVAGEAETLNTVNQFVDTLKFTNYTTSVDNQNRPLAFSGVVLQRFERNDQGATYEVVFKFDPAIFNSGSDVALVVPKIVSTRSQTEQPGDLFQLPTTAPTPDGINQGTEE